MMAWSLLPLAFGAAASVCTLIGGLIAFRLGDRISLVAGLAGGIVLGVALFDLLPESWELGSPEHAPGALLAGLAAGLSAYMVLDRLLVHKGGDASPRSHLGPASLTLHSFTDGIGIGLAFHASPALGGIITLAVLAHDLSDGVNVVVLCMAGGGRRHARRWLIADAAAPIAGVLASQFIAVPAATLSLMLAAFAGAFIYIAVCELLPRSFASNGPVLATTTMVCGLVMMFGVVNLAGR